MTIPHDTLQQHAENFLNFEIRDTHRVEAEKHSEGLYNYNITIPANRNTETTFYNLRICAECGHTQAMNFSAYKKNRPQEAKQLLEEKRREKAEKYIENGIQPPTDERLKNKIETAHLNWNNSQCERTHPPR